MRVPHGRVGGRGAALDYPCIPCRGHGRAGKGRMPAHGSVLGARTERQRGRRLPRLPPAPGPRMLSSSHGGGSTTRIRPDLLSGRKSTRLNSSHLVISYAVFCLKKKKNPDCNTHTDDTV